MRRLSRLAGLLAALMLLAGCQREPTLWQQESYVFGTRVQITTADVPENVARPAVAAAQRQVAAPGFVCAREQAMP